MIDAEKLRSIAYELQPQLVAWRRDFHQYPELAFQEFRSSEIIAQTLRQQQFHPATGIAETGLFAHIEGQRPSPRIMLRFDMDALPISEQTGAAYASKNEGVMHACGHDGHMAIGLGVASVLREIQAELPGSVVLLFQPAEEGEGGAKRMIAEGVLNQISADAALGMHLWNEKPLGWMGISTAAGMAGSDKFTISVSGRGGHGAQPHLTNDPVMAAAHIVTALQSVISRRVDPREAAVLSVTRIHGGEAFNVIPSTVELQGTLRYFSSETHERLLSEIERVCTQQARSFNCQSAIDIQEITPPLNNDGKLANLLVARFARFMVDLHIDQEFQVLGSEDMAFFLNEVPGCYFFLGSANAERHLDATHHNPRFDFDEIVLRDGVYLCVLAALTIMEAG